jgi:hypothetical protein
MFMALNDARSSAQPESNTRFPTKVDTRVTSVTKLKKNSPPPTVKTPGFKLVLRVQQVLETDRASRERLGQKTHEIQHKSGDMVPFAPEVVQVAQALFDEGFKNEKVPIKAVLRMALKFFYLADSAAPAIESDDDNEMPVTEENSPSLSDDSGVPLGDSQTSNSDAGDATPDSEEPALPVEHTPTPALESRRQEIEILYGDAKGVYFVHPAASMFPLVQGPAYDEILRSIDADGQQEPCVIDGKTFLDGRHRVIILNKLGRAPRIIQFAELKTELSPEAWIMTKNLQRRHLTDDQRLAIASRFQAWSKKASKRQRASAAAAESSQNSKKEHDDTHEAEDNQTTNPEETATSEFRQDSAENAGKRKRGRPPGQRSEAKALAKETKQSRYRSQKIKEIEKQSPELAEKIVNGQIGLKEAIRQLEQQKPKSTQSDHQPKADAMAKAVSNAQKSLSKLAAKLDENDLEAFWQQVASFATDQIKAGEASE